MRGEKMKIPPKSLEWKKKKNTNIEKMQQHLQNLDSMLDHKIYCLMLELCDMRHEIKQLQMDLYQIREMEKLK